MTNSQTPANRGSAVLGTIFGAILGGMISLLIVLVSFGQYKERVDGLREDLGELQQQLAAQPDALPQYEIQAEIEAFCRKHPEICGGNTGTAVNAELDQLDRRVQALETSAPRSTDPVRPGAVSTIQPGQVLLKEDDVTFHLERAIRKTSGTVRVELQIVPTRNVELSFDLQYAVGIRAVDMQGRDYKANPIEFAGGTNRGNSKLMQGTVVPLVLDFAMPSDVTTIRTIRARIAFDGGSWQEIETPAIAIAD